MQACLQTAGVSDLSKASLKVTDPTPPFEGRECAMQESKFRSTAILLPILHCHTRPHYVVVEWRLAVFSYEHWLDEETDLAYIAP